MHAPPLPHLWERRVELSMGAVLSSLSSTQNSHWRRLLHGELTFLTCELKPLCSVAHGFAVRRGLTICVDRQQNEDVP